jgi:ElaA protein
MKFEFKHFNELSNVELYDMLRLRAEIFVVEQTCIYNDLDGLDKDAIHLIIKKDDEIVGCSRLLQPGTRFPDFSIGRVVVKKNMRGTGLGIRMMEEAKKYMIEQWNAQNIKVSAQKYLQKFYEDLGFSVITEDYLEDGIPHIGMVFQFQSTK